MNVGLKGCLSGEGSLSSFGFLPIPHLSLRLWNVGRKSAMTGL
jgi:hypothetical protein